MGAIMARNKWQVAWAKENPDKVREHQERYEKRHYDERRRKARERMRRKNQRVPLDQYWQQMRASGMSKAQFREHVAKQKAAGAWG
jgi:hypothetical protein